MMYLYEGSAGEACKLASSLYPLDVVGSQRLLTGFERLS